MGRPCYVFLRCHHDVRIRCRGDVPLRHLRDVPSRHRWVFHLRRTWDVAGTYRETSLQPHYDVLFLGESVVGDLMKGKSGRFAKNIFFFLCTSTYHGCSRVLIVDKAINQDDDKGMNISCILIFKGQPGFLDILSQELKKGL